MNYYCLRCGGEMASGVYTLCPECEEADAVSEDCRMDARCDEAAYRELHRSDT